MKIILSPTASDKTTQVSVDGLIITIDGTEYDLGLIPEGGQAEASEDGPFVGIMTREQVSILFHYNSALAEPNQSKDWNDYVFDTVSGVVPCPITWRPLPDLVEEVQ